MKLIRNKQTREVRVWWDTTPAFPALPADAPVVRLEPDYDPATEEVIEIKDTVEEFEAKSGKTRIGKMRYQDDGRVEADEPARAPTRNQTARKLLGGRKDTDNVTVADLLQVFSGLDRRDS